MLSKTFSFMIIVSFVSGALTGRFDQMSSAFSSSLTAAVQLIISLCGMMCFWSGFMNVLTKAGALDVISKLLSPIIKLIYKDVDKETQRYISASVTANFFGLGNAALPLGIRAIKSFEKNNKTCFATDNAVMFAVMNTVPFQLLPTTLIAMRGAAGSENPFDILPAVWICSVLINIFAVFVCKLFSRLWGIDKK